MKKVLYVIIGICSLYLILAFFGPSKIVVEREVNIQKGLPIIKEKLGDFKYFHDQWSPWTELDPAMTVSYEGTPGTLGHFHSWKGNKDVGSGSMRLTLFNSDTIRYALNFENEGESTVNLIMNEKAGSTTVKWQIVMDVPFFGRTVMLFMDMDKMMGSDFEKGLANLKRVIEAIKEEQAIAYEIKEVQWPASNYVGVKETLGFDKMSEFFGKNYQLIATELGKNHIQPEAAPSAIYWNFNETAKTADVAAVFKVAKGIKLKGFENFPFPESKVLQIAYYGDYSGSANAHYAMDDHIKKNNYTIQGVIEEYVTDPMSEKDTSKWLTNIYYLVK